MAVTRWIPCPDCPPGPYVDARDLAGHYLAAHDDTAPPNIPERRWAFPPPTRPEDREADREADRLTRIDESRLP